MVHVLIWHREVKEDKIEKGEFILKISYMFLRSHQSMTNAHLSILEYHLDFPNTFSLSRS